MRKYIKRCPQCGRENPEEALVCAGEDCSAFLAMVRPEPAPDPAAESPRPAPYTGSAKGTDDDAADDSTTQRYDAITSHCELQVIGAPAVYQVQDGDVIGQPDPDSGAQIQLDGIPGANFVHRRHCLLAWRNGQWYATAIDQAAFGRDFTNPTLVNGQALAAGQSRAVNTGDRLTLSGVSLLIRVL